MTAWTPNLQRRTDPRPLCVPPALPTVHNFSLYITLPSNQPPSQLCTHPCPSLLHLFPYI